MKINNGKEAASIIKNIAENIENLKVIYTNTDTISNTSLQYEKEIINEKLELVEFLNSGYNYEEWKNTSNNNSLFLFKYIANGYFKHELKNELDLKTKLNLDFKSLYDASDKKSLLLNIEKQHIGKDFSSQENLIKNLYNQKKLFNKNFLFMLDSLPQPAKMSELLNKCIVLIKKNPMLLKDHSEHFVANRNQTKYKTYTTEEFGILITNASIGDKESIGKAEKLLYCLESLERKDSHIETIKSTRDTYLSNDDKNTFANKNKNKNSF